MLCHQLSTDRIWSLDTVIKCSKMSSIAPVRLACFHAIMSLYGLAIFYRTPRSLFESFSTHVTCTVYNLKQKIYNILRSRFGSIVLRNCHAVLYIQPLRRYGYVSLRKLLFSKLLCSLIPLVFTFPCTTVLPVLHVQ
jgi:hypothetical protein